MVQLADRAKTPSGYVPFKADGVGHQLEFGY